MRDELGLDYTTDNPDCVQLFCEALENYLASSAQVIPSLEQLLEQDPAMPMALLFRAYLLKFAAAPRFRAVSTSHCPSTQLRSMFMSLAIAAMFSRLITT